MAGRAYLVLAALLEFGVFVLFAIDSDHFNPQQLWTFTIISHEQLEVLFAAVSVVLYAAYARANRKGEPGVVLHGAD